MIGVHCYRRPPDNRPQVVLGEASSRVTSKAMHTISTVEPLNFNVTYSLQKTLVRDKRLSHTLGSVLTNDHMTCHVDDPPIALTWKGKTFGPVLSLSVFCTIGGWYC